MRICFLIFHQENWLFEIDNDNGLLDISIFARLSFVYDINITKHDVLYRVIDNKCVSFWWGSTLFKNGG